MSRTITIDLQKDSKDLITEIQLGKEIIITNNGKKIARVTPEDEPSTALIDAFDKALKNAPENKKICSKDIKLEWLKDLKPTTRTLTEIADDQRELTKEVYGRYLTEEEVVQMVDEARRELQEKGEI